MTHGSLFSGIGGAELAAQWAGWENVFHCEINPFGRKVLDYYWPKAKSYADIKQTDFSIWRNRIDVLTGGFPCQPFSAAGKRKGTEDDRHLWPEMLRAIQEIQPRYIVGENVRGFTNWNGGLVFDQVLSDLENEGYEVTPFLLPACGVNAPHRRDRIWIVAYSESYRNRGGLQPMESQNGGIRESKERGENYSEPGNNGKIGFTTNSSSNRREWLREGAQNENGQSGSEHTGIMAGRFEGLCNDGDVTDTSNSKLQRRLHPDGSETTERYTSACDAPGGRRHTWQNFPTQPPICSGNDGFSTFMDTDTFFRSIGVEHPRQPAIGFAKWRNESIKAFGNAWVPQVAYEIFKVINQMESTI